MATDPDIKNINLNPLIGAASGLIDSSVYPTPTRDMDSAGASENSSIIAGGNLGGHARQAIRRALGWQYRGSDSKANLKAFQAALGKAFRFRQVEGRTEWDWVPQGYTVQADLGEITGAQASIYRQAQLMLDQTLPLIDRLDPLRNIADEDDIETLRSITRSELSDLVSELGRPGGPRVQKVDHFFSLLIASYVGPRGAHAEYDPSSPDFGGQLRRFRDRLGMRNDSVNSVDEEVLYTDFLLLVDNIASLHRAWSQKRPFFTGEKSPFFGTLLTMLARQLEVIAESVQSLYGVLDSVYIGASQRQVIDLGSQKVYLKSNAEADDDGTALTDDDVPELSSRALKFEEILKQDNAGVFITKKASAGAGPSKSLRCWLNADAAGFRNKRPRFLTAIRKITKAKNISSALRAIDEVESLMPRKAFVEFSEDMGVKPEKLGPEAQSLTLDGLLNWVETFATQEGRSLLEQGGKDGATTFGGTASKLSDFVGQVAAYSAQHAPELYAEIGGFVTNNPGQLSSGLDFHPGLHTPRVYRALRGLYTNLRRAAVLALPKSINHRPTVLREDPESDAHDGLDSKNTTSIGNGPTFGLQFQDSHHKQDVVLNIHNDDDDDEGDDNVEEHNDPEKLEEPTATPQAPAAPENANAAGTTKSRKSPGKTKN